MIREVFFEKLFKKISRENCINTGFLKIFAKKIKKIKKSACIIF